MDGPFLANLRDFCFLLFYFMHHALHVLDAPAAFRNGRWLRALQLIFKYSITLIINRLKVDRPARALIFMAARRMSAAVFTRTTHRMNNTHACECTRMYISSWNSLVKTTCSSSPIGSSSFSSCSSSPGYGSALSSSIASWLGVGP